MNIKIVNEFSPDKLEEVRAVYASVGWKKHTTELISTVFNRSDIISLAVMDEVVVGVGRALSDGVFNAAIYDVVVHFEYQRKGIASLIMSDLLQQLKGVSCIMLISTTGNEAFYKKQGMKQVKTGMARYLNPALEEEYLI